MARVSIILIAVGIVLIPEAYWAAQGGGWGSEGSIRKGSPKSSETSFLWRGQTLEGNITASAPIDFYIMDETNYQAFAEGQSWQPQTSLLDISNASLCYTAPASGFYRIVVNLKPPQESANLTIDITSYGIDRDHYDSGLAFILAGTVLGVIALISFLRSKFLLKASEKGFQHQFTKKSIVFGDSFQIHFVLISLMTLR